MTKGGIKMVNNSDVQFLIMQATIEVNKKHYDENIKWLREDLKQLVTSTIT